MTGADPAAFDPGRFFDSFPRFVHSSETGPWLDRLNARYFALIHANRAVFAGARVLDLASHDGRFGFAALMNGAAHVVGVDVKGHLVETAIEHFVGYGIHPSRFELLVGDMYDYLDSPRSFDVVLCFGILYHVNDHHGLLRRIADTGPHAVLIDSLTSPLDGAVVEVRSPLSGGTPEPGSQLEGHPSRGALEAWCSSFGWTTDWFDWAGSGLTDRPHMKDYRSGRRVSIAVNCPEHAVNQAVREAAVAAVLAEQQERETQFLVITLVAQRFGITPQALQTWVRAAEAAGWRRDSFRPTGPT